MMNDENRKLHAQMLSLAERLAREAADISLSRIESAASSQKFDKSVVTTTDHEIQSLIVRAIGEAFPDHAICGEETAPTPGARVAPEGARFCWVIDPLDGTRNYVARVPCFATSIAVLDHGVPVVGVVYEHNTRQLFSATLGGGATLNGSEIRASDLGSESEHMLGVPTSKDEMAIRVAGAWHAIRGYVCRNLGSTAFEMGLIACGGMSGMLGRRVKIWDIAAGALLIREAGGVFTDPAGAPLLPFRTDADPQQDIPFLAAGARMHENLLRSIRVAMA
jgi:myo-inositol-1(or 4)-monophosphatase